MGFRVEGPRLRVDWLRMLVLEFRVWGEDFGARCSGVGVIGYESRVEG